MSTGPPAFPGRRAKKSVITVCAAPPPADAAPTEPVPVVMGGGRYWYFTALRAAALRAPAADALRTLIASPSVPCACMQARWHFSTGIAAPKGPAPACRHDNAPKWHPLCLHCSSALSDPLPDPGSQFTQEY